MIFPLLQFSLIYNLPVSRLFAGSLFIATKSIVSCFGVKAENLPFFMNAEGKRRDGSANKISVNNTDESKRRRERSHEKSSSQDPFPKPAA